MEALAILVVAAVMAWAVVLDRRDKRRELKLSLLVGIIDEGVAVAEIGSVAIKREAVFNAARSWQKQPPEDAKNQIKGDKFMHDALKPAREIAHQMAKGHIYKTIYGLCDGDVKSALQNLVAVRGVLDDCIRMRIICAKINIPDPLRPFLYRFL